MYICIYHNYAAHADGGCDRRDRRPRETSMKEVYKRMSLIIPPDLHRAFKAAAAAEGKEMTELILEFIQQYVKKHLPASLAKKTGGRQ